MAVYSANSVISNTADHESEAHPLRLQDGSFVRISRIDPGAAGGHTGNTSYIAKSTSPDGAPGSWSAPSSVYSSAYDDRNISAGVLASGRIVVIFRRFNAAGSTTIDNGLIYSDDGGDTWSAYQTLSMGAVLVHFGPIRLALDGRHYVAAYATSRVEIWFSADGITWPTGTRYVVSTDTNVTEPAVLQLEADSWIAVCRQDTSPRTVGHYFYASADGQTWGTRTQLSSLSAYWMSAPWLMADYFTRTAYLFGGERRGATGSSELGSKILVHTADFDALVASPNTAWTLAHSFTRPVPSTYTFYGYPYCSESRDGSALVVFTENYSPDAGGNEEADLWGFTVTGVNLGVTLTATPESDHITLSNTALGGTATVYERRVVG